MGDGRAETRGGRIRGVAGRLTAELPYRFGVGTPDPVTFVIAVALAAAISTGVFAHATKHGSRHATAWGIAAFLAAGVAVPVYVIRHLTRRGVRS